MAKIRRALPADIPQILNVVKESLAPYGLELDPEGVDADIVNMQSAYFEGGGWFAVLEEDGEIVGSYGLMPEGNKSCELRKMYLYTHVQGRGLGKQIMDNAMLKARELGFVRMSLVTNSLLFKALQLYERYGFSENKDEDIPPRCDMAMELML